MKQTPAHDIFNTDLLEIMPRGLKRVIEVGSSSGALARAYKAINSSCEYIGVEIDPDYAELSRSSCSQVVCGNIEHLEESKFEQLFPSDCWVFADVLEHLYDPWSVLRRIREKLQVDSHIIACIPNAQHWSVQARLNCGLFRYEDMGLLDRTHIRWFTRITIIELFQSTGFKIEQGLPRVMQGEPTQDQLAAIRDMAKAIGADPELSVSDAIPFQWVVRAVPV